MRESSPPTRCSGPAMVVGPMVWGISPELPGTGLGALTYAMRHVGRSAGRSAAAAMVPETLRRGVRGRRRHAAHRHQGRRASPARATRPRHGLHRRHRDHGARSSCRPATRTTRSWPGSRIRRRRRTIAGRAVADRSRTTTATSRRSTRIVDRAAACCARRASRSARRRSIVARRSPRSHRGYSMMAQRSGARPARACSSTSPSALDPTWRPAGRHVFSLEVLFTPYGLPGGWPTSAEPRRWLDQVARCCAARASSTRSSTGGR